MRACPSCQRVVEDHAAACASCGMTLVPSSSPPPAHTGEARDPREEDTAAGRPSARASAAPRVVVTESFAPGESPEARTSRDPAAHAIARAVAPPADGSVVDDPFPPGRVVLSHYAIVKPLGRGGMGAVYLARHDVTGQLVAIKVLPAQLARDSGVRERFVREAQALAALDHEGIVPLVTFAIEGDDRFLVMKFLPGESLDAHLRRVGPLAAQDAARIVTSMLHALGYAHERGVIHRDIKPANVVLTAPDGDRPSRVVLVDFGIARREEQGERLTRTGMLMGTPQYMSPELILGADVDGRSDLYACGLVLFELLSGRPPFDGDNVFTVLRAHVDTPVPDLLACRTASLLALGRSDDGVPSALIEVCLRLLHKDPARRYASSSDALAALARVDAAAFTGTTSSSPPAATASPTPLTTPPLPRAAVMSVNNVASPAHSIAPSTAELAQALPRNPLPRVAAAVAVVVTIAIVAAVALAPPTSQPASVTPSLSGVEASPLAAPPVPTKEARPVAPSTTAPSPPSMASRSQATLPPPTVPTRAPVAAPVVRARTRTLPPDAAADAHAPPLRPRPTELDEQRVRKVTNTTLHRASACYAEHILVDQPDARGEVVLLVTVDPSGAIANVVVKRSPFASAPFMSCLTDAIRTWQFPAFDGAPDVLTHKMVFRPT